MKRRLLPLSLLLLAVSAGAAGLHLGESRAIKTVLDWFDYAYLLPDGEPVYYIGATLRFQVTLDNQTQRTFNNLESRAYLVWAEDASCLRSWYDGSAASFRRGQLLPGSSDSGLRSVPMAKQGGASYMVVYPIPLSMCPGRAEVVIEGRHRNASGRETVASYRIPSGIDLRGPRR